MEFKYEPALLAYMDKHRKHTILVELVQINNSDFEISELHVRFVDERLKRQFLDKGYRLNTTEHGEVLLPRFPLDMKPVVSFGLKRFLFWNHLTYSGIKRLD